MATSQDDNFDGLFKNLLLPMQSVINQSSTGNQRDLHKELDSYLAHLKSSSDESSSVFVEAAIMIQNVSFLYQNNVNQVVDSMTKLVQKFKSYQKYTTSTVDESTEQVENSNPLKKNFGGKKVEEKRKNIYTSFEPIEIKLFNTLKSFDYKSINLNTLPPLKRIALNTNIKPNNKKNAGLPNIYDGNGENIGKKYDFKMNRPLNSQLTVCEGFDWSTHVNHGTTNLDIPPMDLMNVDVCDNTDLGQSPVILDQIYHTDEVTDDNTMAPMPANRVNVDKFMVSDLIVKSNIYSNKPNNTKKSVKGKKSMKTNKRMNNENLNNDNLHQITDAEPQSEIVDNFQIDQEEEKDEEVDEVLAMIKRVNNWHNKLQTVLKEEENIPKFDINKYGTDILNSFTCIGEEKSFKELVQGKNKSEVSRCFLTVLIMANTNNLKITKPDGELYIKLLKRETSKELQLCITSQTVSNQD